MTSLVGKELGIEFSGVGVAASAGTDRGAAAYQSSGTEVREPQSRRSVSEGVEGPHLWQLWCLPRDASNSWNTGVERLGGEGADSEDLSETQHSINEG